MNSKPTTDQVCGMKLGEGAAKEFLLSDGREYYFCSVGCRAEFERHPEDYTETVQVDDGVKPNV
ncbi:MAG TPA: YHS domain-containing protein [Pyrinomonadaceae bacterium]|nr:YHS domain-containing protein [Pyrinomonadaceae bacterium]